MPGIFVKQQPTTNNLFIFCPTYSTPFYCQDWFYGDAINAKNCVECECDPQANTVFWLHDKMCTLQTQQLALIMFLLRERRDVIISQDNAFASQALRFVPKRSANM